MLGPSLRMRKKLEYPPGNRAPFPRTLGTAETLIFRPAANPTYNRHMQGQLTDKTTDVYTAVCCFTLHWHVCLDL